MVYKKIILIVFLTGSFIFGMSQNTMQIDDREGVVNSTLQLSISVNNNQEFVSFQCDIVLPEDFTIIDYSWELTSRSPDHVLNVTNIGNNSFRLLSYSLSNSPFSGDSGSVVLFIVNTAKTIGSYPVSVNNAILGNINSENIIDTTYSGEITLQLTGTNVNTYNDEIVIYPNPASELVKIHINKPQALTEYLEIYDLSGKLIKNHIPYSNYNALNEMCLSTSELLGKGFIEGYYIFKFIYPDKRSIQKMVFIKTP